MFNWMILSMTFIPVRVPMKDEAIALNWPLVNPAPSMKPKSNAIQWDIADDPRQYGTVKLWYRSAFVGYAATEMLVVPASTHVRLTEMRILLDQQDFKCWPIDIKRENGITCLDVLVAIYLTLQRPLMGEEVQNALHWRPGIMKRVNLLSARRLFHGLIQDGDTWTALLW
ncbi:hypothetical protein C8R42DRAFT_332194 [Lentinula raphanica]|nr:hypothetical protein C8R42DRAFT_332194 [Lentinula raphanica]